MRWIRGQARRPAGILTAMVGTFLLIALAAPPAAEAQSMSVQACRRIDIRQVPQGSQLTYSQCSTQFTGADPYVALVVHIRQIRSRVAVLVELLDPDQTVVWTRRGAIEPPEGSDIYYSDFWIWGLLPLSADTSRLVADNPVFLFGLIRSSGRPLRERVGEWTFRASLNNGPPLVVKFTLQAAPGAPAASPSPDSPAPTGPSPATPVPVPSPSPSP